MKAIWPMHACCRRALASQTAYETGLTANSTIQPLVIPFRSHQSSISSVSRQPRRFIVSSTSLSSSTATPAHLPNSTLQADPTINSKPAEFSRSQNNLSSERVLSHLNNLFEGLQPPLTAGVARRMVTHKGWVSPSATSEASQHNSKLSLIGRRVIRLYIAIFLKAHHKSLPHLQVTGAVEDINDAVEKLAHTLTLGKYVGSKWELEQNMFWRQTFSSDGRITGVAKVSGTAVEAIIGGLYRQYGALVALNAFNSRVLPFLPLPDNIRESAIQLARRSGQLSLMSPEAVIMSHE